jgi:hypothetical protein
VISNANVFRADGIATAAQRTHAKSPSEHALEKNDEPKGDKLNDCRSRKRRLVYEIVHSNRHVHHKHQSKVISGTRDMDNTKERADMIR